VWLKPALQRFFHRSKIEEKTLSTRHSNEMPSRRGGKSFTTSLKREADKTKNLTSIKQWRVTSDLFKPLTGRCSFQHYNYLLAEAKFPGKPLKKEYYQWTEADDISWLTELSTDNIIAVWNSPSNEVARGQKVLYIHIRHFDSVVQAYRASKQSRSGQYHVTRVTSGNMVSGEQEYPNDYTFEMFTSAARKHFPPETSYWKRGTGAHECFHAKFFPDTTLQMLWSKHGKVLMQGAANKYCHTTHSAWAFFEAVYKELSQENISPPPSPLKKPLTPSQRSKLVTDELSNYHGYDLEPKFTNSGRSVSTKLPDDVPTVWRRLLPTVLTDELHTKLKASVHAKHDVDRCYYASIRVYNSPDERTAIVNRIEYRTTAACAILDSWHTSPTDPPQDAAEESLQREHNIPSTNTRPIVAEAMTLATSVLNPIIMTEHNARQRRAAVKSAKAAEKKADKEDENELATVKRQLAELQKHARALAAKRDKKEALPPRQEKKRKTPGEPPSRPLTKRRIVVEPVTRTTPALHTNANSLDIELSSVPMSETDATLAITNIAYLARTGRTPPASPNVGEDEDDQSDRSHPSPPPTPEHFSPAFPPSASITTGRAAPRPALPPLPAAPAPLPAPAGLANLGLLNNMPTPAFPGALPSPLAFNPQLASMFMHWFQQQSQQRSQPAPTGGKVPPMPSAPQ
jgi:hypothetical protein